MYPVSSKRRFSWTFPSALTDICTTAPQNQNSEYTASAITNNRSCRSIRQVSPATAQADQSNRAVGSAAGLRRTHSEVIVPVTAIPTQTSPAFHNPTSRYC